MIELSNLIDEPDFEYAEDILLRSVAKGIRVADLDKVKQQCKLELSLREKSIQDKWGINLNKLYISLELLIGNKYGFKPNCVDDIRKLASMGYEPALDVLAYLKVKDCLSKANTLSRYTECNRVYPNVTRGVTNRISYNEPALISYSKLNLEMMIRPRNVGDRLVSVDIKSEEPWILFNSLGVEEVKQCMIPTNHNGLYEDLYEYTGNKIETPSQRKQVKKAVLGTIYGMGDKSLKENVVGVDGVAIKKVIKNFEEIKEYIQECKEQLREKDNIVKTYFDTEIEIPKDQLNLARILNYMVQGTASDILALMVCGVQEQLEERGLSEDIEIYYVRYDEILFNISKDYVDKHSEEEIKDTLRSIIYTEIDDWVAFGYDIEFIKERDSMGNEVTNSTLIDSLE